MDKKIRGEIGKIDSLIEEILKHGATISDERVRKTAEKWLKSSYHVLVSVLQDNGKAKNGLDFLFFSVHNRRLIRQKWLQKLNFIKKTLSVLSLKTPDEILFFDPNTPFTAYRVLQELFAKAKREILIFDGYVQEKTLDVLLRIPHKNIQIKILTNNVYGNFKRELSKFKKEYQNCEVRFFSTVHDRFFLIDDECFVCGISLHSLGDKKASSILKMDNFNPQFKIFFASIWDKSFKV